MKKMANEGVKDMGKGLQDLITDIANTEDTTPVSYTHLTLPTTPYV